MNVKPPIDVPWQHAALRRGAACRAGVNVRILLLAAVILVVLVGGAYFGARYRRQRLVDRALAEGLAAYARGDWENARIGLGRYLGSHPEECEILAQYAAAQLALRPLPADALPQAQQAYAHILRAKPADEAAFRRLAEIDETVGNFVDLEYVARRRLEQRPDDLEALLCQAKASLFQHRPAEGITRLEELLAKAQAEVAAGRAGAAVGVEAAVLLADVLLQRDPGDAEDYARAGQVLAQAQELDPNSALAGLARAAWLRNAPAESRAADPNAVLAAARPALLAAEQLPIPDPRWQLRFADEWLQHRDYARAQAHIDAARASAPAAVDRYFLDPSEWQAELFVEAANVALVSGMSPAAQAELAGAALAQLKDRPAYPHVLPQTLELFASAGQAPRARQALDEYLQSLKLAPADVDRDERLAYLRAIVARAEGKPYEVIALLAPFGETDKMRPITRALLAEAYVQTGQPGRALKAFPSTPAAADLAPLRAYALLRLGAWRQALELLRELLAQHPQDVELQVQRVAAELGVTAEQAERERTQTLARLQEELAALRAAQPARADVPVLLATVQERLGQPDAAERTLRAALADERCTDRLRIRLALARVYDDDAHAAPADRLQRARAVLEEACQNDAASAAPWLALRDLLLSHDDVAGARQVLERAAAAVAKADQHGIAVARALLELERGDRAAGSAALRQLAAEDPNDVAVRLRLVSQAEVQADPAAAQKLVDEMKEVEGEAGLRWRFAQAVLLRARRSDAERGRAEELLKYCANADPSWSAPVLMLGQMVEQRGDRAAAEALYRNAYAQSGNPEAGYALLRVLASKERTGEQMELLNKLSQESGARGLPARRLLLALGNAPGTAAQGMDETDPRVSGDDRNPEDLRWRALFARQRGDFDRALEYLDQACRLAPETIDFPREKVLTLQAAGRDAEAVAYLDDLVQRTPTFDAKFLRAWYYQHTGQPDRAEALYRELAETADSANGPELLGLFYVENNRLEDAITTWSAALQRFPDAAALRRNLANALLARGRPADRPRIGELLQQLAAAAPDDLQLLFLQAVEQAGAQTADGIAAARKLLRTALATHAVAPPATYRGLVGLALQLNELELARDLGLRGLQQQGAGRDPTLLGMVARAQLELGDPLQAQKLAQDALTREPAEVAAREVALEAAQRAKDTAALQEGVRQIAELLKKNPDQPALQILHARGLLLLGKQPEALSALASFAETPAGRRCPQALGLLADLYRQVRRDAEHADAVAGQIAGLLDDAAYQIAPEDVPAFLALSAWALGRQDERLAERVYRRVLATNPVQPDALNNLGWILVKPPGAERAACEEGLRLGQQAVALRPEDPYYRDTLALALQRLHRLDDAREQYRACAEKAEDENLRTRDPARQKQLAQVRGVALLHLAETSFQLKDLGRIAEYLNEAQRIFDGFSPEQRAEIERLLNSVPRSEGA